MSEQVCRANEAELTVDVLALVRGVRLPCPAPAQTRSSVPPGYGVQEQCLPFVAATSLGWLVPSPIGFGLCPPGEVPSGAAPFRSPLDRPGVTESRDPRVFYVVDDPGCSFTRNAFILDAPGVAEATGRGPTVAEPGLSFFDRADQADLFKLHLPYILRTPPRVDALFLPPINRTHPGLTVLSGLVQTDWYTTSVNLVLRKPAAGGALHMKAGEPVAQIVLVPRATQSPRLNPLPHHARTARDLRRGLGDWYLRHDADRSAYKRLARARGPSPAPG